MPRYCSYPNCTTIVESGRCELHRKQVDAERGSSSARGYSWKWRQYSKRRLRRLPLCGHREDGTRSPEHSICTRDGRVVAATCTDHIVPPLSAGDVGTPEFERLFWDRTNHQSLCDRCHSLKTATEDSSFAPRGRRTDRGESHRYVVTGELPAARAWIGERARVGVDLVWDFHAVASALAYRGERIPDDEQRHVSWPVMKSALVMRDAFIAWLATTTLYRADVYVIVGDAEASALARRIAGEVVNALG